MSNLMLELFLSIMLNKRCDSKKGMNIIKSLRTYYDLHRSLRLGLLLFTSLFLMLFFPAFTEAEEATEKPIPVYYNNEAIQFNIEPILEDGTTLVEFRPIFEKLGLEITWNPKTRTILGYKEGLSVQLQLGSSIAIVNGVEQQLLLTPKIVNERTMVPLRFVSEAAGSYVQWDNVGRIIHLYRVSPDKATTTNNYSTIQGRTPNDMKWMRFDIYSEGDEDSFTTAYAQPEDGYVQTELYLPNGTGTYQIVVYQTKFNEKEDEKLFTYNATFSVVNYGNSGLHLSSTHTDNSQLRLYGELLEEDRTILLLIENELTKEIKKIFFAPVDQIVDKDIYLTLGQGTYKMEIYRTVEHINNVMFEELYIMNTYQITNNDPRDPDLVPSEMVESEHPDIIALAQQITQGLTSDQQKSRKIHDWVAGNIDYDAATFLSGGDRVDTALETLRSRLTDCDGYARLNVALHRAVGIRARVIVGTVIDIQSGESWASVDLDNPNHAWNEVFVDERWITHDPTWNAGYIGDNNQFIRVLGHEYFDPNPEVFARDHRVYTNMDYKYE